MHVSGAYQNTDNKILNSFQLKPPGSEYAAATLGIKDGYYAYKLGDSHSVKTNIKANDKVNVQIKVNNGKGELYLNGSKLPTNNFNVPSNSNIKFGLEGYDNMSGRVS